MNLPFDAEQFLRVFATYNAAVWPAQIVAYGLGLIAVGGLLASRMASRRIILAILAIMWAWNGLAYHLTYFSPINPVAKVFAWFFVAHTALFATCTVSPGISASGPDLVGDASRPEPSSSMQCSSTKSSAPWPNTGSCRARCSGWPCPTTIFTIGVLLQSHGRIMAALSVIPILWALIGTSAAFLLAISEVWLGACRRLAHYCDHRGLDRP